MPTSRPWNAPEHHERELHPKAAKAMDVYSFGMLCLWLLFAVGASSTLPLPPWLPQGGGKSLSFHDSLSDLDLLEDWKGDSDSDSLMLRWVSWLIEGHA